MREINEEKRNEREEKLGEYCRKGNRKGIRKGGKSEWEGTNRGEEQREKTG